MQQLQRFLNKAKALESFLIERSGDDFFVNTGICFSTFSYGTGAFIPIKNIETPFPFKEKEKFYIKFSISPNLQVTGAEIKCQKVGTDCEDQNTCDWKDYPVMINIEPKDEFYTEEHLRGRVKTIKDGKRQLSCFTLIGIRTDDKISQDSSSSSSSSSANTGIVPALQILNTNIIMMASMFSGVPCVFPMPYFNGDLLEAVHGNRFIPIDISLITTTTTTTTTTAPPPPPPN